MSPPIASASTSASRSTSGRPPSLKLTQSGGTERPWLDRLVFTCVFSFSGFSECLSAAAGGKVC